MQKLLSYLKHWLPTRFGGRRFVLDEYHFDLTSFHGDVSEWLSKFPISEQNVEIYFALAELFRRRGEFDKAVAVHEAILQVTKDSHAHAEIVLEIAQDYYAAGVLSHAEDLLVKALAHADDKISRQAFRLWLTILESEQEWQRAVQLVQDYGIPGSGGLRLANLYCEYIEQNRRDWTLTQLNKVIKQALKFGVSSRIQLIAAEVAMEQGQIENAIQAYRALMQGDAKRVNLALPALARLSKRNHSEAKLVRFLFDFYLRHPSVRILEVLLAFMPSVPTDLQRAVQKIALEQVRAGESVVVLEYWLDQQSEAVQQALEDIAPVFKKHSLSVSDENVCTECGFYSEKLVWQCPQCGAWETMFSRYELKIEQQQKKVT